jgi:hypothetical protein
MRIDSIRYAPNVNPTAANVPFGMDLLGSFNSPAKKQQENMETKIVNHM